MRSQEPGTFSYYRSERLETFSPHSHRQSLYIPFKYVLTSHQAQVSHEVHAFIMYLTWVT